MSLWLRCFFLLNTRGAVLLMIVVYIVWLNGAGLKHLISVLKWWHYLGGHEPPSKEGLFFYCLFIEDIFLLKDSLANGELMQA